MIKAEFVALGVVLVAVSRSISTGGCEPAHLQLVVLTRADEGHSQLISLRVTSEKPVVVRQIVSGCSCVTIDDCGELPEVVSLRESLMLRIRFDLRDNRSSLRPGVDVQLQDRSWVFLPLPVTP